MDIYSPDSLINTMYYLMVIPMSRSALLILKVLIQYEEASLLADESGM